MKLFEPYQLAGMTLKNRVIMEPMCMYQCKQHDGLANSFHLAHYTARAIGQVGAIIVEATGILPEGRISDLCLGLYNDAQRDAFKPIVDAVHREGSLIGIQLNHAGRKCTADVPTIYGPSALAYDDKSRLPKALDEQEIQEILAAFKAAARRAKEAGFDFLEIHGAHGYLISQFMSSAANKRSDRYAVGSSFLKDVVGAVREVWDKPLLLRISATDYENQSVTDTIAMLKDVVDLVDCINVSSGGITPKAPEKIYSGYQVDMALAIKEALDLPVIACGLLGSLDLVSYLLESDKVDLIGLARPLLRNPHWVIEASLKEKTPVVPESYRRGFR